MSAHENQNLVRNALRAYQQKDVDSVMSTFADDIVFEIPGDSPITGTYRGKQQVGEFFGKLNQLSNGTSTLDVQNVYAAGDEKVVATWVAHAEKGGESIDSQAGFIFTVKEGKITHALNMQADPDRVDSFWRDS